jgi:hypothetical protein
MDGSWIISPLLGLALAGTAGQDRRSDGGQ